MMTEDLKIRVTYVDGLADVFGQENEVVDLVICQGRLTVASVLNKKRTTSVALDKITDVRAVKDCQLTEAHLAGPLGQRVSKVSATGEAQKITSQQQFILVTYADEAGSKQMAFEVVGESGELDQFVAALPKDADSPFA